MKRIFPVLIFLLAVSYVSAFAETEIKAEIDKTQLSADEMLTYKLTVISTEKLLPTPKVPEFSGFEVVSQAQSTTCSYLEKGAKCILVYAFVLQPQSAGKAVIPPSSIKVKGKEYTTRSFEIEVTGQTPSLPQIPAQQNEPKVTL